MEQSRWPTAKVWPGGLREAAPHGIDAFIDLFGPDYVQLAADLGIDVDRIETIISFEKAKEIGAKAEGSGTASNPEVLAEMAGLVASGAIEDPIAATFPLEQVADAFELLEQRHTERQDRPHPLTGPDPDLDGLLGPRAHPRSRLPPTSGAISCTIR